jgi:putative transposase
MKARHVSAGEMYATHSESRRDGTMGHKYPNVLVHLVFSTKNREPLIPPELQPKLHAYISGIGKNKQIPVITVGGTNNHIHALITLPSDVSVSKVVQVLKANSSRWLSEHRIPFQWQEGYGAFSVSAPSCDAVIAYITNQPAHHAKRSFDDEFASMLRKAGLAFESTELLD